MRRDGDDGEPLVSFSVSDQWLLAAAIAVALLVGRCAVG